MDISGKFHDGKKSTSMEARLRLANPDGFRVIGVSDEVLLANVQFQELKILSRLGNTPRRIEFPSGETFVTTDNDAIDQIITKLSDKRLPSLLHKMETNLAFIVFAVIATVGLLALAVTRGIPYMSEAIAYQMPNSFQASLGEGSLDLLDGLLFDPSALSQSEKDRVSALVTPILESRPSLQANLQFRSGIGPNAFALPNGTIVLTDELIELAQDDEELLSVLFHELGHLQYRHAVRRVLQDSIVTLGIITVTGDVESANILTGLTTFMVDMGYSRDFELEADTYALRSMQADNMNLDKFATIMRRLAESYEIEAENETEAASPTTRVAEGIKNYISSHPATHDRIALIDQFKTR